MLRYHNNQTQVYDGNAWLAMGGGSSVGLTSNAEEALAWAWLKMAQEKAAQDLAQKYPAVADALEAVRLAEQQLKTVVALCTV
jgi:myo-inositol catabolism protein IolC